MKRTMQKLFFRKIRMTLPRFLSIFFIVALGVAFFVGIRSAKPDMKQSANAFYEQNRLMDLKLYKATGITEQEIKQIAKIDGVDQVEGSYVTDFLIEKAQKQWLIRAIPKLQHCNQLVLTAGRYPRKQTECLMDQLFLKKAGYRIGDCILYKTEEGQKKVTIIGTCNSPEYIGLLRGNSLVGSGEVNGYIVLEKEMFGKRPYDSCYVRIKKKTPAAAYTKKYEKQVKAVAKRIAKQFPTILQTDRNAIQTYVEYAQDADRVGALANVFPMIFFLVAAFVSLTTMTRMVEEERTEIGILQALGKTKQSITWLYLRYALFATISGGILGGIVGGIVLPRVIMKAYQIIYPGLTTMKTTIDGGILFGAVGFACCLIFCSTFFACRKVCMMLPASLMRPKTPKQGKRIWLERRTWIWRRLHFTWKCSLRNFVRYQKRFWMTLFGIGGCTALILVGYGIRDSIACMIPLQFQEIQKYQATVNLRTTLDSKEEMAFCKWLKKQPGVKGAAFAIDQTVNVYAKGKQETAHLVVYQDVAQRPDYVQFRNRKTGQIYQMPKTGAVITEKIAKLLHVREGDQILFREEGGKKKRVRIERIIENYVHHYIYLHPEQYQKITGNDLHGQEVHLILKPMNQKQRDQLAKKILQQPVVLGVQYSQTIREHFEDMIQSLHFVVWILILSAGALAWIVLYNLNYLSLTERKREFATLRVLGFHPEEVTRLLFRENMIITLFGIGFGLILGTGLHHYVIQTVEVNMTMFGRRIMWSSYGKSICITMLFALLLQIQMHFQLKKIELASSLKSVE